MKKLLIASLTTLTIITPSVHAGERMAKNDRVEIHKECFMHTVLVDKDVKESHYTQEVYEINDNYRPIFWFKDEDKIQYSKLFNVINSKCYSKYGLKRTGCCGCPYGKDCNFELSVLEKHEPKLYKAVNNVFKDSYEYTKKYYEFRRSYND